MSSRAARVALSSLVAALLAAVLAGPAAAGTEITIATNEGATHSGRQAVTKSGAISSTEVSPVGPSMQTGHQPSVFLGRARDSFRTFLNCDPAKPVTTATDFMIDKTVVHHAKDLSGTPGDITRVEVAIANVGSRGTTAFPLQALGASARLYQVSANGTTVRELEVPLVPIGVSGGERARLGASLPPRFATNEGNGRTKVDVAFTGTVTPALSGRPTASPQGCPPPNQSLSALRDTGFNEIEIGGISVVLSVEPAREMVLQPREAAVTDGDQKSFAAWDCPLDADGRPDVGQDGEPGTDDDFCEPITVDWSLDGGIGALSPGTGTTTSFTADLPDGAEAGDGRVIAADGDRRATVAVTVNARPRAIPSTSSPEVSGPPTPCECESVDARLSDVTILRGDRQERQKVRIRFDVDWTLTCTAGAGDGCRGVIRLASHGRRFVEPRDNRVARVDCRGRCTRSARGTSELTLDTGKYRIAKNAIRVGFGVRMALACVDARGVEGAARTKEFAFSVKPQQKGYGGVLVAGDSDLDGDGKRDRPREKPKKRGRG